MLEYVRIFAGAAVLFLLLIAQSLFLWSSFQLRFELAVPISLMSDMLVLLFCGLFISNLLVGIYLIFAISLVGLLISVIRGLKNLRAFFSVGFLVFTIGYLFCWLVSLRHIAYAWDDFGHWLPFVKQMVYYDKLYNLPEVYLIRHWYYTPAMPLLQYFACKLAGGYSAGVCFAVSTFVLFSSVLPVMKWLKSRVQIINVLSVFLVFFSVFFTGHEDLNGYFIGFGSAYVDIQLSVICAMLLLWGYFEKDSLSKSIYLSLIASFLCMVKVTGIMFSMLGVGTYMFMNIANWIYKKVCSSNPPNFNWKAVGINLIPIISVIAIYGLWSIYSYPDMEYNSVIGIDFTQVVHCVQKYGQGLTLRKVPVTADWLRTYFYHFFTTEINSSAIFPVTASPILIIFLCILFIKFKAEKVHQITNVKVCILAVCVVLGLFVYLTAIGISFYSLQENLDTMTSYQRYLSSYIGVITVLTYVFALQVFLVDLSFAPKTKAAIFSAMVIALAVIMPTDIVPTILGNAYSTNDASRENENEYKRLTVWGQNICANVLDGSNKNPKAFLLMDYNSFPDTPSLNGEVAVISYFTLPVNLQNFGQFKYSPDLSLSFYTKDEWSTLLLDEGFSHVILSNFSPESMIWWKSASTDNLSKMHALFDVPPEELSYTTSLLFQVCTDDKGQVHLNPVLVENLIK